MKRKTITEIGEITYEIERKMVKNLNLRVRQDGSVHVSVPYYTSYEQADRFVALNCRFVERAREKFAMRSPKKDGAVYFLGEELKLSAVKGEKFSACIRGGELLLTVTDENNVQAGIDRWRKEESEKLFPPLCREEHALFKEAGFDVPLPKICFRKMKSRWGSCTADCGKITLNTMLTEKPLMCIRYVIAHELAHFVVQDHSERFYKVLDIVMPEHKEIRKMMR